MNASGAPGVARMFREDTAVIVTSGIVASTTHVDVARLRSKNKNNINLLLLF